MGWEMGGQFKREWIYVYLWLIHVEVWQKTTKFCKAIILQLKNKQNLKIDIILIIFFSSFKDISLMGKMYWQKSPQMQAEQGPQISIKDTQMVMCLIKVLLTYFKVIVCFCCFNVLSRELKKNLLWFILEACLTINTSNLIPYGESWLFWLTIFLSQMFSAKAQNSSERKDF